jgi:fatty-acyl-CoA synthase
MDSFIVSTTSGTTGAPKAVIYSEQALLRMGEVDMIDLDLTPKSLIGVDRFGLTWIRRMYDARVSGASLCVYPGQEKQSLRTWINDRRITHLSLLATTVRWVASGISTHPTVEVLEIGGEMVDWGDIPLARRTFPNARIFNRYAASEVHIVCRKLIAPDESGEGRCPVGKPVSGVRVEIENGEIKVKSPMRCEGYYNDPELTARKFRNGWYYTGDQGYFLGNGELMHGGRI